MMDIRAAKELKNSSLWKEVENEIEYRIRSEMERLLSCEDNDILAVRTRIRCLKELSKMPETVIEREQ
jgi:hypothetical protein